jgi:hypothetical protein
MILPRGPLLALCRFPLEVRRRIAAFLAPRLRLAAVHPAALLVRSLLFSLELPRRLVVYARWEHRLWTASGSPVAARPLPRWPRAPHPVDDPETQLLLRPRNLGSSRTGL